MKLYDNSRLPIGTGESHMFLNITRIQLKLFKKELINLSSKCNTIIEFCATPLLCKGFYLSSKEKKELESIINKLKVISNKLDTIYKDTENI